MTLSASVSALRSAVRSYYGVGRMSIYADPRLLIAFTPSDPEYAAYETRLSAVSTRYTYLSLNTNYGYPSNTLANASAHFDALSSGDKAGPLMCNLEYPWLEILQRGTSGSVDSSWVTDTSVAYEFARTGVNGGTPVGATITQMQTVAKSLWQAFTAYAHTNGCPNVIHYASTGAPFSIDVGPPMGQCRYLGDAPPSGKGWWKVDPVYRKNLRGYFDDAIADDKIGPMIEAQTGADAIGAACYCLVPNGDRAVAAMPNWTHPAVVRLNGASAIQTPGFDADVLRWGVKNTSRRMWAEARRAIVKAVEAGDLAAADIPDRMAAVVLGGALMQQVGSDTSVLFQWSGCDQKDAARTAEDEITAIFLDGDTDDPLARGPDDLWIWHDVRYYFITEPTRAVSGETNSNYVKTSNMARNTMEIAWLGRAAIAGDEPWSATDHATHHAWYAANRMSDAYWCDSSKVWWTPQGGSQLPAACAFDPESGPLAQYLALVNPSYLGAPITQAIAVKAMRHAVSEISVSFVEAARTALDAIRR